MLSTLEDSGYLVSLAEAAEEVEGEDEGIGGEGGEVEEDYDVIEDRDVPSNEEVQVGKTLCSTCGCGPDK